MEQNNISLEAPATKVTKKIDSQKLAEVKAQLLKDGPINPKNKPIKPLNESAIEDYDVEAKPGSRLRYNSSHDSLHEFAPAHIYYGAEHDLNSTVKGMARNKGRTLSTVCFP